MVERTRKAPQEHRRVNMQAPTCRRGHKTGIAPQRTGHLARTDKIEWPRATKGVASDVPKKTLSDEELPSEKFGHHKFSRQVSEVGRQRTREGVEAQVPKRQLNLPKKETPTHHDPLLFFLFLETSLFCLPDAYQDLSRESSDWVSAGPLVTCSVG